MTSPIPAGFRLGGFHCGLKRNPNKEDLSLIVCDEDTVAAGVYTTNLVVAAPVVWDRERTPSDKIRAVITNSGNANACTGEQGVKDNAEMASIVAKMAGVSADQVLTMSTGIIGHHLPMEKIRAGLDEVFQRLGTDESHFDAAARGIMTTDKGKKIASRECEVNGKTVKLIGMCKGAGMIAPNMATMLSVVLTDAELTPDQAKSLLTSVTNDTFNCITVDGHRSTNDTLLLLASGKAGTGKVEGAALDSLRSELRQLCEDLAKQIPADGEGSTHLIEINIEGCASREDAARIAKTVADSALVKTAITGGDPNWGRIVSAAGYSGVSFDPMGMQLIVNGHLLYQQGTPVKFDEKTVSQSIKDSFETDITLRFTEGDTKFRYWSSDLTVEYVRFNSEYRT
ncbi:bifunctional glutamate N-acetyltransferase/amino-acid acetyltransferase ArgJ [bacterium]|nr:bifunctional glutamate N-acetyltransferase/amino-acid acetyltransferase ArgJ [bacterium]